MRPLRILMLGDIVGRPGRHACRDHVHTWRKSRRLDFIFANGENASGGNGLSVKNAEELFSYGIDIITSGNHIWKQKDYAELFERFRNVIRPANYPDSIPGKGWGIIESVDGARVGVLNLQGQVFMDPIDSPFSAAEKCLSEIRKITPIIIVDFHAEATSERVAMGLHLDGKVTAVLGTHTHIATADTRILPGGTAYQTDIGMVGPHDGILGIESGQVIKKFLTCLPVRFQVAKGPVICGGVILTVDPGNGIAIEIERFEENHNGSEDYNNNEDLNDAEHKSR
ncbi:MAG: TIGR00282 family metallophosphoesterase [bacterium]|nr:TIGR00282 family metallophosphoesterase [bacterium]